MSRLIDLDDDRNIFCGHDGEYEKWNIDPDTIEERPTGKWIEAEDFYNRIRGRCSVCGWESHMYEDDVVGMNYCPNCGADMRG